MSLRAILIDFFKVSFNLSNRVNTIDQREFVEAVTNDEEANYRLFSRFAAGRSSTHLCVMHELGYCKKNERLVNIIWEELNVRDAWGHDEEDAGSGHIGRFLRGIGRAGKC